MRRCAYPNTVVLEMTSPEGILQAVAAGAGLTILPEFDVYMRCTHRLFCSKPSSCAIPFRTTVWD